MHVTEKPIIRRKLSNPFRHRKGRGLDMRILIESTRETLPGYKMRVLNEAHGPIPHVLKCFAHQWKIFRKWKGFSLYIMSTCLVKVILNPPRPRDSARRGPSLAKRPKASSSSLGRRHIRNECPVARSNRSPEEVASGDIRRRLHGRRAGSRRKSAGHWSGGPGARAATRDRRSKSSVCPQPRRHTKITPTQAKPIAPREAENRSIGAAHRIMVRYCTKAGQARSPRKQEYPLAMDPKDPLLPFRSRQAQRETIEFWVPKGSLDVRDYIKQDHKQGIHHLGRYTWALPVVKGRTRILDIALWRRIRLEAHGRCPSRL